MYFLLFFFGGFNTFHFNFSPVGLFTTRNSNEIKYNELNSIDHLKDFITEPIDYGDYFSVFNDIDEDKGNSKDKIIIKEPEPDII